MSAPTSLLYLLSVLLFFALDAHHVVIAGLVESCRLLPPFSPVAGDAGAWMLLGAFGQYFRIGLQIAAPCVVVLLLVSAAMGVLVKTVPQMNVLIVGLPLKIAVGLAVMGVSMIFFSEVFGNLIRGLETQLSDLIGALQA